MRLSLRYATVAATWVAAVSTALGNETYKFDAARSAIEFRVHQFLGTTKGKFTRFSGTIDLDREHPEKSSVIAKIQVKSIDTGIRKRDNHLLNAEFFDAARFPEITFKSRSVKRKGDRDGDIMGDFTMHGVTKPVTLHVTLVSPASDKEPLKRTVWQVATEPIKRRDFGLMFSPTTEGVSGIGQEVTVNIQIEAIPAK